jgi:hypothetical protein
VQLLAGWVSAAQHTLEIAIYDVRLPDPFGPVLFDALTGAAKRGVAVRLAYNYEEDEHPVPVPPPPKTEPGLIDSLPFPTARIPGVPDLMHH